MTTRRRLFFLALVLPLTVVASGASFAACVNPDRPEGTIIYNTTFNVPQYCNGTDWVAFGALNPAAGGSGCTDPEAPEGKVAYNADFHVLQYCDGDDWRAVGSGRAVGGGGSGFLGFTDLVGQSTSTLLVSNILQVALSASPAAISIAGDGSPQYRICSDQACAAMIQSWGSSLGNINSGEFLQLRQTSNASFGETNSAAVAVGAASDHWDVSTAGQDTTPDDFSFTDQTNVALSALIESNTVTIAGINDPAGVSVNGDGSPEFRVDGGSWTSSPATIANGQTLQLRLTSGGSAETRIGTVTVGTVSRQWSVSTSSQDTTPDAFSFTDQTGVPLNALTTSNVVTITGITGSVSISVSGAGTPQISIAGGSWGTSGTILSGQTLQVRLTSANSGSTLRSATVTVGSANEQWDVTTEDVTPDAFGFTDQTNVVQGTLSTSNSITISGISGTVGVSVSGSGSPQIRIAGGSWVTTGTIANGQTLQVRLTAADTASTANAATVTVGASNDQWDVTTQTACGFAVWTPHDSDRNWRGMAASNDGAKLVTVVANGQIYTSSDSGTTWTPHESNRDWDSVASSADGAKLVAVVRNGQIYTSTDSGGTWTARASSKNWNSVASSADGTKLVAAGYDPEKIYTSVDSGVTWTARESNRTWMGVASSADGTKLVALHNAGKIYTSADSGVTWTARESNRSWQQVASSADGTKLAATVDNGKIYTSTDSGATWTARENNRRWFAIAVSADGSRIASTVTFDGMIYTSADGGVTWTPWEANRDWNGVSMSADGMKITAADFGGKIYTSQCQ